MRIIFTFIVATWVSNIFAQNNRLKPIIFRSDNSIVYSSGSKIIDTTSKVIILNLVDGIPVNVLVQKNGLVIVDAKFKDISLGDCGAYFCENLLTDKGTFSYSRIAEGDPIEKIIFKKESGEIEMYLKSREETILLNK